MLERPVEPQDPSEEAAAATAKRQSLEAVLVGLSVAAVSPDGEQVLPCAAADVEPVQHATPGCGWWRPAGRAPWKQTS